MKNMVQESSLYSQAKSIIEKAQKVLLCVNNRSSFDTHFAVAAMKKYLESEGKNVMVATNGELILKHKRMFQKEGIECAEQLQSLNYVITIDHAEGNIERVSYDDKDGKFRLYITPVEGTDEFNFKKVSYSQGGGEVDAIVVFGCRSLKWLDELYEQNKELFEKVPVININNLSGTQEYGTVVLVNERIAVCEALLNVIRSELSADSAHISDLLLRGVLDHLQPLQGNDYRISAVESITELVRLGADLKESFKSIYFDHTYNNFEVQRKVMSNFKYDETTGVAWSSVSSLDLTQCGVDRETFILDGRIIFNLCGDFKVAFVLYEVQEGEIVVELESNRKEIDAKELLSGFKVAGTSARIFFTIRDKTIAEVEESIVTMISRKVGLGGVVLPTKISEMDEGVDEMKAEERVEKPIPQKVSKTVAREEEKRISKGDPHESRTGMKHEESTISDAKKREEVEKSRPHKTSSLQKGLVVPPPVDTDEG